MESDKLQRVNHNKEKQSKKKLGKTQVQTCRNKKLKGMINAIKIKNRRR
jgi:hypothetical protein